MRALTRYALVAALALATVLVALGEGVQAQNNACFEVIPARPNIEPPAAIMVDKCSGKSWVLIRTGKNYRWSLITTELEKPKIADRAPVEGAAPAPEPGPQKCFTFNGRKFCE